MAKYHALQGQQDLALHPLAILPHQSRNYKKSPYLSGL